MVYQSDAKNCSSRHMYTSTMSHRPLARKRTSPRKYREESVIAPVPHLPVSLPLASPRSTSRYASQNRSLDRTWTQGCMTNASFLGNNRWQDHVNRPNQSAKQSGRHETSISRLPTMSNVPMASSGTTIYRPQSRAVYVSNPHHPEIYAVSYGYDCNSTNGQSSLIKAVAAHGVHSAVSRDSGTHAPGFPMGSHNKFITGPASSVARAPIGWDNRVTGSCNRTRPAFSHRTVSDSSRRAPAGNTVSNRPPAGHTFYNLMACMKGLVWLRFLTFVMVPTFNTMWPPLLEGLTVR